MPRHPIDDPDTLPSPSPGAPAPESAAERATRRRMATLLLARTRIALGTIDAAWLDDCLDAVAAADADDVRTFELAFGLAPRRLRRETLLAEPEASAAFAAEAAALMSGWRPQRWRLDDAVRALLLVAAGDARAPTLLVAALRRAGAETRPALYRALVLLPPDPAVLACVHHGLDTAGPAVFEAIAHDTPWPARHLDEAGWNRLVLRGLTLGSALGPVRGLEARANPTLATRLLTHARACELDGRPVPRELWRALGPHAARPDHAPPHLAGRTRRNA